MRKRNAFEYRGHKVVPAGTHNPDRPNWGKCDEPRDFHDGRTRTQWWRIESPCGKWLDAPTKAAARTATDKLETRPDHLKGHTK